MTWHQWDDDTTQAALDGARLAYRHPQVRQAAALEDVEQDALEYIATHPDEVEAYKANGWTHVLVKLRLIDKYRYDKPHVPLTENHETSSVYVPDTAANVPYTRDKIEDLLCLMFDPDWCHGPGNEYRPDGDMPKAKANPARGPEWIAELVDLKNAWTRALLIRRQRAAIALRYGTAATVEQIAARLGTSTATVSRDVDTALDVLYRELNGQGARHE